jgi:hypothetical protein
MDYLFRLGFSDIILKPYQTQKFLSSGIFNPCLSQIAHMVAVRRSLKSCHESDTDRTQKSNYLKIKDVK